MKSVTFAWSDVRPGALYSMATLTKIKSSQQLFVDVTMSSQNWK